MISKIWEWAKKIPWWGWVIGIAAFFFLINYASSLALNRSLFNMALDNLREDKTRILETKDEWIKTCEQEISRLQREVDRVQKEKAAVQAQAAQTAAEVARLKGRINELQTQLQNIVVSDDPDRIIDDLRRLGIRSIRKR